MFHFVFWVLGREEGAIDAEDEVAEREEAVQHLGHKVRDQEVATPLKIQFLNKD